MKRTRLDRRTKVAGVIAAALLLSCCLLAGCGQEKTETTTDALDTMENQAGDVSISLGPADGDDLLWRRHGLSGRHLSGG